MYPIDLHCHTTRSDGKDTPQEFLKRASGLGMKIVAICDHDIRPPFTIEVDGKEQPIAEYAKTLALELIRGIEISCDTENEDVHIVAMGCNWKDPWFDELESFVARSKYEGYQKIISALTKNGYDITMDEVLARFGNTATPEFLQKKHVFEVLAEKGYTKTWKDAKILLQTNPNLNCKRAKPQASDVIAAVHKAGGVAILAHPYLIDENPILESGEHITRHDYIMRLLELGLDGIEARYTYEKTSYTGTLSAEKIYNQVVARYPARIISGGSDYHADYKSNAAKAREIGEAGLTEDEFYGNPLLVSLLT